MKINPDMIESDRVVFRDFEGKKVVIARKSMDADNYMDFIDFGKNKVISARLPDGTIRDFDPADNITFTLNELLIEEDSITISMFINSNTKIRSFWYMNNLGEIHESNVLYVPEPEDPSISYSACLVFPNLKEIVTDPDMFEELLEKGVINADSEVLRKFDVEPVFFISIKGGNKQKNKTKMQKPKLTIAKNTDS